LFFQRADPCHVAGAGGARGAAGTQGDDRQKTRSGPSGGELQKLHIPQKMPRMLRGVKPHAMDK